MLEVYDHYSLYISLFQYGDRRDNTIITITTTTINLTLDYDVIRISTGNLLIPAIKKC